MNKYLAELLGTYALVFAGTGAIVIDQQTNGSITHVGIAITFGLIVMSMIYTFGDISGAHINPAVSIAFTVAGRFLQRRVPARLAERRACSRRDDVCRGMRSALDTISGWNRGAADRAGGA